MSRTRTRSPARNFRCGLTIVGACQPFINHAPILIRLAGQPLPRLNATTYAAGTANWRACETQKTRLQARVSLWRMGRWAHADASGGQARSPSTLTPVLAQEYVELTSIRGGNIRLEKAKITAILEVHACAQAEPPSSSSPTATPPSDLANTASGIVTDSGMVAATPAALNQPCCSQLGDLPQDANSWRPAHGGAKDNEAFHPIPVRPSRLAILKLTCSSGAHGPD